MTGAEVGRFTDGTPQAALTSHFKGIKASSRTHRDEYVRSWVHRQGGGAGGGGGGGPSQREHDTRQISSDVMCR